MDNFDKILNELKQMDRSKRNDLMDVLEKSMSESQQKKLKQMISNKSGQQELSQQLENIDLQKMVDSVSGKPDFTQLLQSDDIKQKLRDLLG